MKLNDLEHKSLWTIVVWHVKDKNKPEKLELHSYYAWKDTEQHAGKRHQVNVKPCLVINIFNSLHIHKLLRKAEIPTDS